jgi:hypothetical protein
MPTRRRVLAGLGAAGLAGVAGRPAEASVGVTHIALLGDSTLDNAAYVARGEDVAAQLGRLMPQGWRAALLAVDGNVTADIGRQLQRLPGDATHLVVSVGGNDALGSAGILQERASSVPQALAMLADIQDSFVEQYRTMLDEVLARGLPTAIATIYNAAFPDPELRRIGATALCVLNDVITREAASRGLPLIDLRTMFSSAEDYANAIEPSAAGGKKIAGAIVRMVSEHDFSARRSEVFVG